MPIIEWEREDDNGDFEIVNVPAKYVVCWDCEGEGSTLNENLRGAFTHEEFHHCFDSEESVEEYRKGGKGIYGVTCKTCNGRTTILVPDDDTELGKEYAEYQDQLEFERECDLRTMRMENGEWQDKRIPPEPNPMLLS